MFSAIYVDRWIQFHTLFKNHIVLVSEEFAVVRRA